MTRLFSFLCTMLISFKLFAVPAEIRLYSEGAAALAARLQSISNAQQLDIETFYFENDRAGRVVLKTLIQEKLNRPAMKIRLLLDGWGSESFSKSMACSLRSKGIEIKFFNQNGGLLNQQRTHRKIWVTESTAFVGGRNISDENFSEMNEELSDWDIELKGAAVSNISNSFSQAWTNRLATIPDCTALTPDESWLREIMNEESWKAEENFSAWSTADVSWHTDEVGNNGSRLVSKAVSELLRTAENSLEIENAYFLPVGEISHELGSAKSRGIRMQFYLNGPKTDVWMARYSTCLPMNEIQWWLDMGAKVSFTPQAKKTHAKSIFIDDRALAIGSYNLDSRSINTNAETLLVIRNSAEIFDLYKSEHNRRMNEGHIVKTIQQIFQSYGLSEKQQNQCLGISVLKPLLKNFF